MLPRADDGGVAQAARTSPLRAFAAFGIELEYAIVDRASLDVRPIADALLAGMAGRAASSVTRGRLGWSNELVRHVVELKNLAPDAALAPLAAAFQREVRDADARLRAQDARLMPSGMHPWMDPRAETLLWDGEGAPVYRAFDAIFDCRRHGWANLQSMHINLPFAGDGEFARLHAAVRAVLPLIPALAASSPIAEARRQPALDYRLEVYRTNQSAIPAITGAVVPDDAQSRRDYEASILAPMYRAVAPHDPAGALQHEWLNARGAIARFDRSAIEIRLCDTQECPRADLAIAALVIAVVQALFEERWAGVAAQRALSTATLAALLRDCTVEADAALIGDPAYLALFGLPPGARAASAVWAYLAEECAGTVRALNAAAEAPLALIARRGPLARRILAALDGRVDRPRLRAVYAQLCDALAADALFDPA